MTIRNGLAGTVFLAVTLAASSAGAQPDTVTATITKIVDTAPDFDASGTLTTTDTTNNGLPGTAFTIVDPSPLAVGPFWRFWIHHETTAPHWGKVGGGLTGAVGVSVCIDGTHIKGPHPADDADNELTEVCTKKPRNIPFGVAGTVVLSAYNRDDHPAGAGGNHFDHYGIKAVVTALQGPATGGNQLTGAFEIRARHTARSKKPADMRGYAMGASPGSGATVSYDALSGVLRCVAPAVDILDAQGGLSGGVATPYGGDPVARGQLGITSLQFQGVVGGEYVFTGGRITVSDPAGRFTVEGSFAKYCIDPRYGTVLAASVGGLALLDSLHVTDVSGKSRGASGFLEDFVDGNVLGGAFSRAERLQLQGLGFSFLTASDLVGATSGFQRSASVPATVLVYAAGGRDALCLFRNGNGVNPADFHCLTDPVLGSIWTTSVTRNANTVATAIAVANRAAPPIALYGGELLFDPLSSAVVLPGYGTHSLPIPNRNALLSAMLATQGIRLDSGPTGAQAVLLNALDIVLGR